MGFCSWLLADGARDSIRVNEQKDVYMIRPDGLKPVLEPCYQGYQTFGGISAFAECARWNMPIIKVGKELDEDEMRGLGLDLHYTKFLFDGAMQRYLTDDDTAIKSLLGLPVHRVEHLTSEGFTISALPQFKPLKFSRNKNANYDRLPKSESCPHQGFLFPAPFAY